MRLKVKQRLQCVAKDLWVRLFLDSSLGGLPGGLLLFGAIALRINGGRDCSAAVEGGAHDGQAILHRRPFCPIQGITLNKQKRIPAHCISLTMVNEPTLLYDTVSLSEIWSAPSHL